MTINFLDGVITKEQYEADPSLIARGANTLKPGEFGFTLIEAIWADEENRLWVDETLNCDFDPGDMCSYDDFVRIIRVDEGYIIDASHMKIDKNDPLFYRVAESDKEAAHKDSAPVIGLITYDEEREMLAGMLKDRYGDEFVLGVVEHPDAAE